jgi:Mycobacterium 19 kDa lipoprotein antigen
VQRPTALLISAASLLWVTGCSTFLTGDVSLTIDGKKQHIRGSVSCSSHAGGDVIEVGDLPAGIYVHLAPGGSRVEDLELGNSTGKPLIAHDAKVSERDGRYDITGEAAPADKKDSGAPKPFELKVKCP